MIAERLKRGVHYLQQCGYQVRVGKSVGNKYGYLAGKDAARADDLNRMFSDPDIDAVFCTRGGYGTPRLLERINFDLIKNYPKVLVGYSDITALQLAIFAKAGVVTFSGPMVAVEMGKGIESFTETHFWEMVTGSRKRFRLSGSHGSLNCIKGGRAEGKLLGGCLSLICSLLGTRFLPDFQDSILVIEDIGEEPYQIDRNLVQLKLSGILNQIAGLVIGRFEDCAPKADSPSLTIEQILDDITVDLDLPIVAGLPYGHIDTKYTIPIGVRSFLDADEGFLEVLEPTVV